MTRDVKDLILMELCSERGKNRQRNRILTAIDAMKESM
jgi:hypothetical protein